MKDRKNPRLKTSGELKLLKWIEQLENHVN